MRNIIIGPAYPYRGGIAHFSESLAKAFIQDDISTVLVSFKYLYPRIFFPGKTQYDEGPPPEDLIIYQTIHSLNPISWIRTARFVLKQNPDYVVFQYWMPFIAPCLGFIARRIKKKSKIKVFSIVHNVTPHEAGLLDRRLSGYFFKSFDGFLTLSSSVLEDLSRYNPKAIARSVHHPVYDFFGEKVSRDEGLKYLNLDPNNKYILFFGLIRKYKGLDLLLEALSDPLLKQKKICLIVAGEFYEKKQEYLELIESLGIREHVILTDRYIPNEEVKYFFAVADMVAQPYKTATQSGVTQIAYHFEKPMLVSNVGGLPEIVPHMKVGYVTGLFSKDISESIQDFYENKRAPAFVKNILSRKHIFQWENVVSEIENMFKEIN